MGPYMNPRVILIRAFSMFGGIPWAMVRNWVNPPTTACTINFLPIIVRYDVPHLSRCLFILSITGSHGTASFVLFPIHAPKNLIALPSSAIFIRSSRPLQSCWFIFCVRTTCSLCSSEPMGTTSVFSMLNLAPDTRHQSSGIIVTRSNESPLLMYTQVSSAKNFAFSGSSSPGREMPLNKSYVPLSKENNY